MENKKTFNELWGEYTSLEYKNDRHYIYIKRINKAIDFAYKYIDKGIKIGAIDTLGKWAKCKRVIQKLEDGRNYCYDICTECNKKQVEILKKMGL